MKNNFLKTFLSVLFCCLLFSCFAQVDEDGFTNKEVVITMRNGDRYTGTVIKKENGIIYLQTLGKQIELVASNVKRIDVESYDSENYEFGSPGDNRYFFNTSFIPNKKGDFYYQNIMLTTNGVNYSFTDNFSVGGGFEFLSTLTGTPIWYLTPKLSYNVAENIHAGGGVLIFGFGDLAIAGLGYGAITYGNSESNLTLSLGYGFAAERGNSETSDIPTIGISGIHRVSDGVGLLSENYIIPESEIMNYFGIHGLRFFNEDSSWDLGVILAQVFVSDLILLPFGGYTYSF